MQINEIIENLELSDTVITIDGIAESNYEKYRKNMNSIIKHYCKDGKKFVIDNLNKEIFLEMFKYFINEQSIYDDKKGFLIYGNSGIGKTTLMKIFAMFLSEYFKEKSFIIKSLNEICFDFIQSGFEGIKCLLSNNKIINQISGINNYCIDDIQTFKSVKFYGSELNIDNIIQTRYRLFSDFNYTTHITTNLSLLEIHESFDFRTFDRLKEMFNFIELKGASRRK